MLIFGIDPGPTDSAFVLYESESRKLVQFMKADNATVMSHVRSQKADVLVLEKIASFGMPVGAEVFETVYWSGRFAEAWLQRWRGARVERITRIQVKVCLCNSVRAKDSNIRQALIDRFGGSREAAIGRKANKGPLYGVTADCWSALALSVTYAEKQP